MLSFMNKDGGCPGEEDRTVNGSSGSSAVDSTKAPQKKTKKYFSNTNKVEHDRVDFESNEPQKDGKKERKKERKKVRIGRAQRRLRRNAETCGKMISDYLSG